MVQFRHVCGGTGALAKVCGEARTGSDRIVRAVSFGAGNKAARNAGPMGMLGLGYLGEPVNSTWDNPYEPSARSGIILKPLIGSRWPWVHSF